MNTKINEVVKKPWGEYKNIYFHENFIVKILTIYPKVKYHFSIINIDQNTGLLQVG